MTLPTKKLAHDANIHPGIGVLIILGLSALGWALILGALFLGML